jgi:diguanylate cyclase (GGDEF)-like protein
MPGLMSTSTRGTSTRTEPQLDPFADSEDLSNALDHIQRHLEATVQRNNDLLRLNSSLAASVSSLELALAKANRFAHYDELTGLPNRRLLLDRFIQASALANRHHQVLAVLFFDVNDFKSVNDKLGHDTGDKLLMQLATRLSSSIRESDTACRYGGDEFVVLLTDIDNRERAVTLLQKVRARLAQPYVIDDHSLRLTVSNGLAIYPSDAQSFTELIGMADRSMFQAKSGSRGRSAGAPQLNIWSHEVAKKSAMTR